MLLQCSQRLLMSNAVLYKKHSPGLAVAMCHSQVLSERARAFRGLLSQHSTPAPLSRLYLIRHKPFQSCMLAHD